MEANVASRTRRPTPEQALGPFYPVKKPDEQDPDLTTVKGAKSVAQGEKIVVEGQVFSTSGKPVAGAQVEIWQANAFGRYIHPQDTNTAPLDPGFQGYGVLKTDANGRYRFTTVKPAAYSIGKGMMRPPHIHFIVTGADSRLVTQLYFEGSPQNETDRILNSVEDKALLIVSFAPDRASGAMTGHWDIVLPEG
jgi:protocatechuate 3,4-dioxygenase beta subunit